MRYILAAKSHVISLSAEANGIDGVSLAVAELEYGYELSRPGVSLTFFVAIQAILLLVTIWTHSKAPG
jgi:hypothetical protein